MFPSIPRFLTITINMFCTRMDMLFCVFVLLSIDNTCAHGDTFFTKNQTPDLISNKQEPIQHPFSEKNNETTKNATQTTADSVLPTNTIIYIAVGVLLAVVVLAQALCFYIYIRSVKETRHTIETIIRSSGTGRSDKSAVRYSKAPVSNIKRTYNAESNVYESLPEIDTGSTKKPPPPPLETLPRKKVPPPPTTGSPKPLMTERIRANSTSSSKGAQSLRREKTIRTPIREPKPVVNRPKLPLPNELPEKPSTLPKKHNDNSPRINKKMPLSMSIPRNDVDKNELMAKIKQRQAMAEVKTDSESNVSSPTKPSSLSRRQKRIPPAPMPPPKPHVRNDSDDSDDEWEIEQLKPINLYNI